MSSSRIEIGHSFANTAEEYEENEEWHKAIGAHNEAAAQFEQALIDQPDPETREQLEILRKTHVQKAKELLDKNIYDMKRLDIQDNPYAAEEEDPFNKFWGVVEPMVDKLSKPLILPSSGSIDSTDDFMSATSSPIYYDTTDNPQETDRIEREMSSISESFFVSSAAKEGKEENEELRAQVLALQNQIKELEKDKKSIDSTVLKSSIIQFKNDVHKQALRILQTQENAMMTRSATTTGSISSKNIRHVGSSTAEIVNRIKELEEANRTLRSQNRKQEALMNKYRERWEKLKEGAKKRQPSNTNLLDTLASHTPPSSIDHE